MTETKRTMTKAEYAAQWLEQQQAIRRMSERHWWQNKAESLLVEAISENLYGEPWVRQQMIDALRSRDDAELGRLVREHAEPYLQGQMEAEHE